MVLSFAKWEVDVLLLTSFRTAIIEFSLRNMEIVGTRS